MCHLISFFNCNHFDLKIIYVILNTVEVIMKYKLIADASCDIPQDLAEKYNISLVPIEVRFGEEIYPQGLSTKDFYNKINETGLIPKTSMPNQFLFEEILSPYVNKPDVHVIVLTISSEMTATIHQVEGAVQALKMQNVTYRQSTVTTWAQGAILIELSKFIEKDNELSHVIKKLDELINKVKLIAVIGDLKYLKASGRLSAAGAVMGSMLNVKPIISLAGGKVTNEAKVMGEAKAFMYMVAKAKNRDKTLPIYFGHSNCPEMIDKLLQKYSPMLDISPKGQTICEIGCVVGSHVGPNCYGLVYFE